MKIKINGKELPLTETQSLDTIIKNILKDSSKVIAELNGEIIKQPQWPDTQVQAGDEIELVSFVGGG